jgi:trehalose utilization protein
MKGITWSRDSHGLFDYESRHLTKRTMKTQEQVQIIRNQNELDLQPYTSTTVVAPTTVEARPLLNIINENGKHFHSKENRF